MGERGGQLGAKAEHHISETIEFLRSLTDADFAVPIHGDRGGSTVGGVAAHLGAGYTQALRFLQAMGIMQWNPAAVAAHAQAFGGGGPFAQTHAPGHNPGHSHDLNGGHGPHDHAAAHHPDNARVHEAIERTIANLEDDGMAAVELLRELTDEQFAFVPPALGTMADGRTPIGDLIEGTIDHQIAHLDRMKQSVAGARESQGAA